MKTFRKATVILLFALVVSSFTTGCAACGNDNTQNMDDMVEGTTTPDNGVIDDGVTEEGINNDGVNDNTVTDNDMIDDTDSVTDVTPDNNGGNATAGDITNNEDTVVDENGYTVDENGNVVDDAGNIVSEAGDAVGDAMDNVGNAVDDVADGVGDGVRSLTR